MRDVKTIPFAEVQQGTPLYANVGGQDRYFTYSDFEDGIRDHIHWGEEVREIRVCSIHHLAAPKADDIIQNELESQEHHEDAELSDAAVKALQDALDTWASVYGREVETWMPDGERVELPAEWLAQKAPA